jgi:hypothetical protein
MARHPRLIQVLWLTVAAALLAGGAAVQGRLNRQSQAYELVAPEEVARNHPEVALLNIAPGGLRAPLVTYLWITADQYKNDGRYFDAMQLADLICTFEPHFEGVWYFHAWNMAWNIAAAAHTPEERWLWVTNGIRLLRDRAIPLNPKGMRLYNQLAWIFHSKIGMTLDDMHLAYKRRWAAEMQRVLGAPPEGETDQVIAAFEPIAQAPLDKSIDRRGRQDIQDGQRQVLLADPRVASYAQRLAAAGLGVDEDFLHAYSRFSNDLAAAQTRLYPPQPSGPAEQAAHDVVNLPEFQPARAKVLAFLRAQLLWNRYRMDPQWMLGLMQRYHVPLDWRLPWPHAVYWISYGMHVSNSMELADITSINTDRIMLGAFQALAWNGRMTYVASPDRPDEPRINYYSDYRYIEPVHNEYMVMIDAVTKTSGERFDNNPFKVGHINFLISAIQMLYVQHRYEQAQYLLDFIKNDYRMEKHIWALSLNDFMAETITSEDLPTSDLARNQITSALQMGMFFLARGQDSAWRDNYNYAQRIYHVFETSGVTERVKLPPLQWVLAAIASEMIVYPRASGYYLPLAGRQRLYGRLDPSVQVLLYDRIAGSALLRREVESNALDFVTLFPGPPGLEEYRQRQQMPDAPPALPSFAEDYIG